MTKSAVLYIVATPIGNLEDLSPRAKRVLQDVDCIAAEDTRHTRQLLQHFNISQQVIAYHAFNEHAKTDSILAKLRAGESVALVSDAGTPLVSDPGYLLVVAAREAGVQVETVPGPCALVAALSVAGLPSQQFYFAGFLPAKASGRDKGLKALVAQACTLVFYESPHRILESLAGMEKVLGDRPAVIARELTKQFETVLSGALSELQQQLKADPNQQRGEFVVMVAGAPETDEAAAEGERVLDILLAEQLPVKQAASLAAKITGASKNALYAKAIKS